MLLRLGLAMGANVYTARFITLFPRSGHKVAVFDDFLQTQINGAKENVIKCASFVLQTPTGLQPIQIIFITLSIRLVVLKNNKSLSIVRQLFLALYYSWLARLLFPHVFWKRKKKPK